ncbi:hypothetical protein [Terrimicrobium sacchariphilum]|nr:hypothetical protein [Terrimicrobium sacchariphilum]
MQSEVIPNVELRRYTPNDYPIIEAWCLAAGIEPIAKGALTDYGVFCTYGGREVACAWFYINNRSPVAKMENLIEVPENPYPEARFELVELFRGEAKRMGKLFDIDTPRTGEAIVPFTFQNEEAFDAIEAEISLHPESAKAEELMPLKHRFVPGMYIREIFIPAGTLLTSRVHQTEHPFTISMGDISVVTPGGGVTRLKAPYTGITKPGTRRMLYAHENTIWTTYHVTKETDPMKIVLGVTDAPRNRFLGGC